MKYQIELRTHLRQGELEHFNKSANSHLHLLDPKKIMLAIYVGDDNEEVINRISKLGAVLKLQRF